MSSDFLWTKDQLAEIFTGVCGAAADFGGWTPDAAAVVGRLCQALDIAPELPESPTGSLAWTVATGDTLALPVGAPKEAPRQAPTGAPIQAPE
jgi:hypothetical protein